MIVGLISGALFRTPESRVSKQGRPFVSATLRVKDGDGSQWVRVVAFSNHCSEELMRLSEGDAVAVQGPLKAETYIASDGSTKVSLSIIADHVLPLRQPQRKQEAHPFDTRTRAERCAGQWSPEAGPSDEMPF